MQNTRQGGKGGSAYALGDYSNAEGGEAGDSATGPGGDGGEARALGKNSRAVGGKGGRGGVGKGGAGMSVEAIAADAVHYGGDGGESCQQDGRGGRGGVAPLMGDVFGPDLARKARMKLPYGAPNIFPGRGGDSPDTPRYKARRLIVERLKEHYLFSKGLPMADAWYDREIVPLEWISTQLARAGHKWAVSIEDDEYVFLDLA